MRLYFLCWVLGAISLHARAVVAFEKVNSHTFQPEANCNISNYNVDSLNSSKLIVYTGTNNYDYSNVGYLYNAHYRYKIPCFIYEVESVDDIVNATKFAKANDLLLRVKGAGRSMVGWSVCEGACIVVDTRKIDYVKFIGDNDRVIATQDSNNNKYKLVKLGAGISNGDAYNQLAGSGYMLSSGSCAPVGFAGLALGGGLGILMRKYGLAIDNVVEMTVVLPNGNVVVANGDTGNKYNDLFWGLKGAGNQNFGIVVEFVVKVYNTKDKLFQVRSYVPKPMKQKYCPDLMNAYQHWLEIAPREFYAQFAYSGDTRCNVNRFNSMGASNVDCSITFSFEGSKEDMDASLATLWAKMPPKFWLDESSDAFAQYSPWKGDNWFVWTPQGYNCTSGNPDDKAGENLPWSSTYQCFSWCGAQSDFGFQGARSRFVFEKISKEGLHKLDDALNNKVNLLNCNSAWVDILVDSLGGAIADVGKTASAFYHRDALYHIQYNTIYEQNDHMLDGNTQCVADPSLPFFSPSDHASYLNCNSWLTYVYNVLGNEVSDAAYINYPNLDLTDAGTKNYGGNLLRLRKLASKYNPMDIYNYSQGIKPN